jgi:hypothetical protein
VALNLFLRARSVLATRKESHDNSAQRNAGDSIADDRRLA